MNFSERKRGECGDIFFVTKSDLSDVEGAEWKARSAWPLFLVDREPVTRILRLSKAVFERYPRQIPRNRRYILKWFKYWTDPEI